MRSREEILERAKVLNYNIGVMENRQEMERDNWALTRDMGLASRLADAKAKFAALMWVLELGEER